MEQWSHFRLVCTFFFERDPDGCIDRSCSRRLRCVLYVLPGRRKIQQLLLKENEEGTHSPQVEQMNGLSSLCWASCCLRLSDLLKAFSHWEHLCRRSSLWESKWFFKVVGSRKDFSHSGWGQDNGFSPGRRSMSTILHAKEELLKKTNVCFKGRVLLLC